MRDVSLTKRALKRCLRDAWLHHLYGRSQCLRDEWLPNPHDRIPYCQHDPLPIRHEHWKSHYGLYLSVLRLSFRGQRSQLYGQYVRLDCG